MDRRVQHFAFYLALAGYGAAMFSRFFTRTVGLPSAVNFLHFGLLLVSLVLTRHPTTPGVRRTLQAAAAFLGVIVFSALVNGVGVARPIVAAILWIEPLILIYVVWATLSTEAQSERFGNWAEWLLIAGIGAQFVLMTWQIPLRGGDLLRGTFLDSQTGAHVAPAVAMVGSMMLVDRAVHGQKRALSLILAAYGFILGLLGYAIGVTAYGLVALAFALILAAPAVGRRAGQAAVAFIAILTLLAIGYFAFPTLGKIPKAEGLERGMSVKRQGPELLILIMSRDPAGALIGLGPGTTASRAALETADGLLKTSSPHAFLGIETTDVTRQFLDIQRSSRIGSSSAYHPWSSFLGVFGDVGVVGFVLYLGIWLPVLRGAFLSGQPPRIAVTGVVVMAAIFGASGIWLEEPGYVLTVALFLVLRANGLLKSRSRSASLR